MNTKTLSALFLTLLVLFPAMLFFPSVSVASPKSGEQDSLAEPLKFFEPYIGKTWKGVFAGSGNQEKKSVDVSHWERALNGTAVRVLHSVNDGEYGGESLIFYDKKEKQLVYFYFTTAGFYTRGTMTVENSRMTAHEMVTGNPHGITEVKSVTEMLPDGRMKTSASYLKKGKWEPGHEVLYEQDPSAKVHFK